MAVKENGSDMLRVFCMALMNAIPTAVTVFGATFATNAAYGVGLTATNYLWISVSGNIVAVILIPFVGNLSDKIGRRPVIIVGAWAPESWPTRTCTSSAEANLPMAFLFAMLMWGVVYQGYNAVFPAFYQELFPTKTRVTAFAVSQNIGTLITAFLPAIYAALVGPTPGACVGRQDSSVPDCRASDGETCRAAGRLHRDRSVVWTVGGITFGLAIIAAIACFTARETFRIHLNDLGRRMRCRFRKRGVRPDPEHRRGRAGLTSQLTA